MENIKQEEKTTNPNHTWLKIPVMVLSSFYSLESETFKNGIHLNHSHCIVNKENETEVLYKALFSEVQDKNKKDKNSFKVPLKIVGKHKIHEISHEFTYLYRLLNKDNEWELYFVMTDSQT